MSIGSVVLLARKYADRVIVVDDGSSGRTADIAATLGLKMVVYSQSRKRHGFEIADDAGYIITMDSDGQHNPADISKLLVPLLKFTFGRSTLESISQVRNFYAFLQ
jgi:glycosyltransferase involved in cell wall biosynthesis